METCYIDLFIHLFINLFQVDIVKTFQKCEKGKEEYWIKKILIDTPDREGR